MNITNEQMDNIISNSQCTVAVPPHSNEYPQRSSTINVSCPDGRMDTVTILSVIKSGGVNHGFVTLGHPKVGSAQPALPTSGMDKPSLNAEHAQQALHAFSY